MSFQLKCCFSVFFFFYSLTISLIPCQTRSSTHWFHHSCVRDCTSLWYSSRLTQLGLKKPIEGLCGFKEEGENRRGWKKAEDDPEKKKLSGVGQKWACVWTHACVGWPVNEKTVPYLGTGVVNAPKPWAWLGLPACPLACLCACSHHCLNFGRSRD